MSKLKTMTQDTIMKTLEWSYDKAINGDIPGMDSAEELAQHYLKKPGTLEEKVKRLIRVQNTKSGTSGFVTKLGGLITLPIAVPANIASVLLVQMQMVGAIAYMGGHDLHDDEVKTFVYLCLVGNEVKDVIKTTGIQVGTKLAKQGIKRIPGEAIKKINQAVGFRLLTKFGSKGVINLGKLVPIAGGIIGGTTDALATNTIGKIAYKIFIVDNKVEKSFVIEI